MSLKTERTVTTTFINSLVGEGSSLRGDFVVQGFFRIDGDFLGRVQTQGRVFISSTGRSQGTLEGRDIMIAGVFKGDIIATEHVRLVSSALVIGNIYAPYIQIEEGVILEGYCCITPRIWLENANSFQTQKNSFTLKIDSSAKISSPLSSFL